MSKKIIHTNATNFDIKQSVEVVWEALFAVREDLISEGDDANDRQWDEICTAMAWIEDELGLEQDNGNG